jgi:hypothetical protein
MPGLTLDLWGAVGVAQLVELLVVVQAVAGSNPVAHLEESPAQGGAFFWSSPGGRGPWHLLGIKVRRTHRHGPSRRFAWKGAVFDLALGVPINSRLG